MAARAFMLMSRTWSSRGRGAGRARPPTRGEVEPVTARDAFRCLPIEFGMVQVRFIHYISALMTARHDAMMSGCQDVRMSNLSISGV
jgi:hypothetical protein